MEGQQNLPITAPGFVRRKSAQLKGGRYMPSVFAGVMSGTLVITFGISLAALIFTGDLVRHLPSGIGLTLLGSAVLGAVVALGSSFRAAVAAPQENTAVIIAIVAASIQSRVQFQSGDDALPTVIVAFALTSLFTGAFFLALGVLRLGKIVRFIPYPVVGGFLAGTGWLLLQGSISVMAGVPLAPGNFPLLFQPDTLLTWLPGLGFGVVLTLLLRRYHHYLLLPALLLVGIGVFYGVLLLSGTPVAAALQKGLLLGPFPEGSFWPSMPLSVLPNVHWTALMASAGDLAAVTILATLSILLNASGLELATEKELNFDRELTVNGLANIASSLCGGMVGYLSLSESTLNHKAGANTRFAGFVCALLCFIALVAGASTLSYFPKPILGGVLLFLGLAFLVETVYDAWFRLPRIEYAVVILILLAVATVGFLEGVGVGIVLSSILFAVSYSRINVVKNAISGSGLRSNVGRSAGDEVTLEMLGDQLHILQLQSYIFFGTAHHLLNRVRERIAMGEEMPLRFILLDFRHVDGLDSSAVVTFTRMKKLAAKFHITLVLTALPETVRRKLERGGFTSEGDQTSHFFTDLDHGLEWCENQILAMSPPSMLPPTMLSGELASVFQGKEKVARFLAYLERVEPPAGHKIYRQGEVSNDLFLIERGELTAWLELGDGQMKRLRTMGTATVVGEAGLYLGAKRSATVVTNGPTVLYRLSIDTLDRITKEAPELAASFHQYVVRLLAERVVSATGAAKALFY